MAPGGLPLADVSASLLSAVDLCQGFVRVAWLDIVVLIGSWVCHIVGRRNPAAVWMAKTLDIYRMNRHRSFECPYASKYDEAASVRWTPEWKPSSF